MKSQRFLKNLRNAIATLMLLPAMAACTSQTAQAPTAPATNVPITPATASPITPSAPSTKQAGNIVEVTSSNASLKTMTAAIQAAGLTSTLEGKGPFTVFAPTDQAFAAVPAAIRQRVLQPENRAILTQILAYHVVPGKFTSSQIKSGDVKTVEGKTVNIEVNAKQVTVNNATVTQPDIRASNGVIHVVDRIILPPDVKL